MVSDPPAGGKLMSSAIVVVKLSLETESYASIYTPTVSVEVRFEKLSQTLIFARFYRMGRVATIFPF